ncbi:hypothetical protein K438DRAFT_1992174 [Mycena galopus ATCC 62051]|nr:hypothetical protein K438DRAFT_1992174 [Mycena galopus ATCC 62051]
MSLPLLMARSPSPHSPSPDEAQNVPFCHRQQQREVAPDLAPPYSRQATPRLSLHGHRHGQRDRRSLADVHGEGPRVPVHLALALVELRLRTSTVRARHRGSTPLADGALPVPQIRLPWSKPKTAPQATDASGKSLPISLPLTPVKQRPDSLFTDTVTGCDTDAYSQMSMEKGRAREYTLPSPSSSSAFGPPQYARDIEEGAYGVPFSRLVRRHRLRGPVDAHFRDRRRREPLASPPHDVAFPTLFPPPCLRVLTAPLFLLISLISVICVHHHHFCVHHPHFL